MEELEKAREEFLKKKKDKKSIGIIIVIGLLLFFVSYYLFFLYLTIVLLAEFRNSFYVDKESLDNYRKVYRKYIVNTALNEVFTDVNFDYEKKIDEKSIRDIGIINIGSHLETEDYYSGKYKNVFFVASDIQSWHESDDAIIYDFKGQYYIIDYNKKFKGNVTIINNYYKDYGLYKRIRDYVEMEDKSFNDNYAVFSADSHNAFYLLTPQLMEKLKKADDELHHINCAFVDNKLHISVYNKVDSFEFDPYEELKVDEEMKKVRQQLKTIIDIVDTLDLDNDLYK